MRSDLWWRISTQPMRLLLCLCLSAILPLGAEITATRDGDRLRVEIDGRLFTEYRNDKWLPCLYPLMSPDGTHLTRRYPFEKDVAGEAKDHPHHIGFWFTHGDINGNDFWHEPKGCRVVTKGFVGEPEIDSSGKVLTFTVDLEWRGKDQKPLLSEQRTYSIQVEGRDRVIDVSCDLKATDKDVVFGDTKEGSFAIRVAPTIRMKGAVAKGGITNSEGLTGGDAWGKRAKWVAFHGPDSAGTPTVIALMDHPSNLRHPTWWHARDYGLLAANPFGPRSYKDKEFKGDAFTLKKGESLKQRYRLVLVQADLAAAPLDKYWQSFSK
ncbi:PmoA family protein [Haloferula sp. A504]|uniref:PmoA family protein n=1 Tax=Haloferula sp. A504 TaxID=3373601 RepID=UPI0031CA004C|nr:PmoA family protein [Verrucomicrobiaceae bacterium E54]